jgi:hypothetical protein
MISRYFAIVWFCPDYFRTDTQPVGSMFLDLTIMSQKTYIFPLKIIGLYYG